jgi:hypothetical protein
MHNRKQLALLEVGARKATAAHAPDDMRGIRKRCLSAGSLDKH